MNHEEIEEMLIPLRDYEKSCREIYLRQSGSLPECGLELGGIQRSGSGQRTTAAMRLEKSRLFLWGISLPNRIALKMRSIEAAVILHDRYAPPFTII